MSREAGNVTSGIIWCYTHAYTGTSQILAQYNAVATVIDEGKSEDSYEDSLQ